MRPGASSPFGAQLKALREAAGFTQEELATIAGLSAHAVSALERGERRRPHVDTVRALSAALDLNGAARDAFLASARAPAVSAAVDELSRGSLPVPPTSILGRDTDVHTLQQWLGDPSARIITLVGPGGVGKTRLALEVARVTENESGRHVVFVPLAAVQESAFVAPAIAEALGLADVSAAELPRRVRAACGSRHIVLVLDNCEHVLDAAPLVADLLASAVSLQVLATSRAPLQVRGERQYPVAPLALPQDAGSASPADHGRAPAVRLFVERVRDVQPEFRLTATNGPKVSAICRRLDALPLALELAARWIKVLTVDDLLGRLECDALLSTSGPRDLAERQQTMNATVAWSYRLLNPAERRAFRRLGVLPGRFSMDAAAAVLAGGEETRAGREAFDTAASLIDKSLLQRAESAVPDRSLYEMLETVRAYATLQLDAAGERDDAMEGLVRYCTQEVVLAADGLAGPAQSDWLNRLRDDLDTYRVALTWLIAHRQHDRACEIAWGLGLFFLIRGYTSEGLRWYGQALNLPSTSPVSEAKALFGLGLMHWAQGQLERARTDVLQALAIAHQAGARVMVVHAEQLLGHVEIAAGQVDAARERYTKSVEGYRALSMPWGLGNALSGLAGVMLAAGDAIEAERLLNEATSVLRQSGPWFLTPVLCIRAVLTLQRGEPDEAMALMYESLTHIRALQDKFAFVYALVPLAGAAVLKGNHAWAARLLGARDAVAESTGAVIVDSLVHHVRERAEREARARLGTDTWTRAYAAGRTASIDSLLKEIEND